MVLSSHTAKYCASHTLCKLAPCACAGFRGGFIFPLMFAGTAFGQALATIPGIPFFSALPPVLLAMTAAAGMLAHHMRPDWHPSPPCANEHLTAQCADAGTCRVMHDARLTHACMVSVPCSACTASRCYPSCHSGPRMPACYGAGYGDMRMS